LYNGEPADLSDGLINCSLFIAAELALVAQIWKAKTLVL
jgi:hypothetical protein